MPKWTLLCGLIFTPLWSTAAPVVFDDGTYKAWLESDDCQPPVMVRVEAHSADDFGYLNERFQESIRQISTLAWLRCSAAKELQIKAIMPPATQPVMEFPVRVAEQWQINPPQRTIASTPSPSPQPTLPPDAKDWAASRQPADNSRLATAVGKAEAVIESLSEEQKLALMEVLAAQAGSLEAWQTLANEAQKGSRTAKLALANLLLRTKDQAPMNGTEFLTEVVQIPEDIASQGPLAAARHLLEELSQDSGGASLGMLPTVDAEQSHDVLQVAFGQQEQEQQASNPASARQSPPTQSTSVTDSAPPQASGAAQNTTTHPGPASPAATVDTRTLPALPAGTPPESTSDSHNPGPETTTTVID